MRGTKQAQSKRMGSLDHLHKNPATGMGKKVSTVHPQHPPTFPQRINILYVLLFAIWSL